MNVFNGIRSRQKRRIALVSIITVIIILLLFGYKAFIHGWYAPTEVIWTTEVKVEENKMIIKGNTNESATGFSGYKYKIENENLYIQVRYSIVSKINSSGHFDIEIIDDELKDVENIYLQGGKSKDTKLVWRNPNGE